MNNTITMMLTAGLLLLMSFFTFQSHQAAKNYEQQSLRSVENNNVTELSKTQLKKWADSISFGFYDGFKEQQQKQQSLKNILAEQHSKAESYALYFALSAIFILLLYFISSIRAFTITLSISALIALAGGLFTPIMMMSVHKEIDYLGDVVLAMESKGVLGAIGKLFDSGNFVIAAALLLFSLIFPLLKTLSMLFVALFVETKFAHTIVHFFKVLGKWSMADVFVVSTFLVYFSASNSDMTRAEVQVGLYFFLAYVILSMFASLSADHMLKRHKER